VVMMYIGVSRRKMCEICSFCTLHFIQTRKWTDKVSVYNGIVLLLLYCYCYSWSINKFNMYSSNTEMLKKCLTEKKNYKEGTCLPWNGYWYPSRCNGFPSSSMFTGKKAKEMRIEKFIFTAIQISDHNS